MRDPISYRARSASDKKLPEYAFQQNTAFRKILDEYNPISHFFSNNLLEDEKNGYYENGNKDWKESYNACIVTPIRLIIQRDGVQEVSTTVGFICVDNFEGGFTGGLAVDVLASFSDLIFHLFNMYNETKRLTPQVIINRLMKNGII